MVRLGSYYRPPRRLPREESTESEEEPRKRDLAVFLLCLAFFAVLLFAGSFVAQGLGQTDISLSLWMFGILFTMVTVGTVVTVAIGYFITGAFVKHELDKKFKKMDEEQQAQLRRMTGYQEEGKESE